MAKPTAMAPYTVRFGGCTASTENWLPIMDGWNYMRNVMEPSQAIIRMATWTIPSAHANYQRSD